jgi:hypothetical protein
MRLCKFKTSTLAVDQADSLPSKEKFQIWLLNQLRTYCKVTAKQRGIWSHFILLEKDKADDKLKADETLQRTIQ